VRQAVAVVALALAALTYGGVAEAQTPPVKNPTAVTFTSVDHAALTGYEVDFVRASDGTVIQTLTVAKAATTVLTNGDVRISYNVQPVAFGTYTLRVRAVAGALSSSNSPNSDPWERVPGAPSKGVVQ
jgi:hypothetical protein